MCPVCVYGPDLGRDDALVVQEQPWDDKAMPRPRETTRRGGPGDTAEAGRRSSWAGERDCWWGAGHLAMTQVLREGKNIQ